MAKSAIVRRRPSEALERAIRTRGVEDCGDLIARATPAQLGRVLETDLWRPSTPGADERFDAERFGVWLQVLVDAGVEVAAAKLEGLDIAMVTEGLSQHLRVFHHAAVSSYVTLDGEHGAGRSTEGRIACEIGGYKIEARRTSAWEAIVELLAFLDADRAKYFHRLMGGCVSLSSGPQEEDASHDLLDAAGQHLFDLASAREVRREREGFVTPAQAHAFLREGRGVRLDAQRPAGSAIARAYFRAIGSTFDDDQRRSDPPSADESTALAAAQPSFVHAHAAAHPESGEQLAFLANAVLAGCAVQGRSLTVPEASDGAVAICNLGLENWPPHWGEPDLVTAFQTGWTILYRDVCVHTANALIDVLLDVRCVDRDIQLRLDGLRHDLMHALGDGEPWRARGALEAIMMLDPPSWAALTALLAECPVMHAAVTAIGHPVRAISATAFTFISRNREIGLVRAFVARLPTVLTG